MSKTVVNLSHLAIEQLAEMPHRPAQFMADGLKRLQSFPESAPKMHLSGYLAYRSLNVRNYHALYRYLPALDEVRVYAIVHVKRRLPHPDFLFFQDF